MLVVVKMYIVPDSYIKILRNVPLNNEYVNTIYFSNSTDQYNYFNGKVKYNLENQSYQRTEQSAVVNVNCDNLYDCNYIMFQNSAYGSKWFYAFITKIEYVSNVVSRIFFEIDVMQTYHFNYTLQQCFVEREHSVRDNIGDNTVPENVNVGNDYIINNSDRYSMSEMSLCILVSKTRTEGIVDDSVVNGVFSPVRIYAGLSVSSDQQSIDNISSILTSIVEEYGTSSIINVYQYPSFLGDGGTHNAVTEIKNVKFNYSDLGGYVPKNRKLFTYPYNYLFVSNNSGSTGIFKYENFSGNKDNADFKITGVFYPTVKILCYPTYYRGVDNDYHTGILMSDFPTCAWNGSAFYDWLRLNANSFSIGMLSQVVGTAMSVGTGNYVGAATGTTGIIQSINEFDRQQSIPAQTYGQLSCNSLNAAMGRLRFSFYQMSIKPQQARIIDDYFTKYGYATNRVKIPNRNARPHFTYTKTVDCSIYGQLTADASQKICSIYNKGITFWVNGNEVGNYSLDNSVPVEVG